MVKFFIEIINVNTKNGNTLNKVKIQIRKDLLNYNLSYKYIVEKNRILKYIVENELLVIESGLPKHVINLPRVNII